MGLIQKMEILDISSPLHMIENLGLLNSSCPLQSWPGHQVSDTFRAQVLMFNTPPLGWVMTAA